MHTPSKAPAAVQEALERLPESAWTVVPELCSEGTIVSETVIDIGGRQQIARRAQSVGDDALQAMNQQEFNDSDGKRWGDGRVAARIPMNRFLSDFAPRLREGDKDFTKWWLNHEDNRPFRTFKGKV